MKIDVFDTYATIGSSKPLHFDVMVAHGTPKEKALAYAESFLVSIGVTKVELKLMLCNFCHSEIANTTMAEDINKHGHFILQLEGCPNPY